MCNSKRSNRFQCTRPPLLPPPERLLSLDSFVKSLLAAQNEVVSEKEVILVNDNAKSPLDSTSLCSVASRSHRQDLSRQGTTVRLGSDCTVAASSPRLPAAKRKNLSRWDSGEAKAAIGANKSASGLCAPIRPKKPQEDPIDPVLEENGPRLNSQRRVRFALPPCNHSVSPLPSSVQPISCTSKPARGKMDQGRYINPKTSTDQKPRRKVTFSGIADMDDRSSDIPPRLVRSTFSLLEAIFESSFSEFSSEDLSLV